MATTPARTETPTETPTELLDAVLQWLRQLDEQATVTPDIQLARLMYIAGGRLQHQAQRMGYDTRPPHMPWLPASPYRVCAGGTVGGAPQPPLPPEGTGAEE